jgi:hypothetical protein
LIFQVICFLGSNLPDPKKFRKADDIGARSSAIKNREIWVMQKSMDLQKDVQPQWTNENSVFMNNTQSLVGHLF